MNILYQARATSNMNSRKNVAGYLAGITAGVSYGFNPLFAKQLLVDHIPVYTMLFYRYVIAAAIMLLWMLIKRENLRMERGQTGLVILLGLIFACSSLGLFESYNYIPAGLATTIVYLYPVFTALAMIFLHQKPSLRTWGSIITTLLGVVLICMPTGGMVIKISGVLLAVSSALCYSVYLVIVNHSARLKTLSAHCLTLYGLAAGAVLFFIITTLKGQPIIGAIKGAEEWRSIIGLSIIPTTISMLSLALSTRLIGPTKTAVLGVFEPITAIMIGLLVFGENLTASIIAGVCICVGAVTFMVTDKN